MSRLSGITSSSRRRTRTYDLNDLSGLIAYLEEYLVPVGSVIHKFTDTSPGQAWLLMSGQAVSKSEYPELYAELYPLIQAGTLSEDATTFTLPDPTDSYLVGVGAVGAAEAAGANTLALSVGQIPTHGHAVTDPGHTHSYTGTPHGHTVTDPGHGHGVTDPGHDHDVAFTGKSNTAATGSSNRITGFDLAGTFDTGQTGTRTTGATVDTAATGLTVDTATAAGTVGGNTTGISIGTTGAGDDIDNRPKSLAVYHFIKARA